MTATLGVIAVLMLGATLMIGAQSAFAQTVLSTVSTEPGQFSELPHADHPQAAYQSGFQHAMNVLIVQPEVTVQMEYR